MPVAWCLAAALLFGASTPLSKLLLGEVGPFTLAGLLYLGAAAGVLPISLRRHARPPLSARRGSVAKLAGAVASGGLAAPVLLLAGLRWAPAASVSLWLTLEAAATALLARALFREDLDARAWAAIALLCSAGVLLAAPAGFSAAPAGLLVALAALCWGLDNNLTAVIDGFTPAQCVLAKGSVAGAVNLGIGLWLEPRLPAGAAAAALALGAASYGLSLALYISGAQQLGAARSQAVFATAPFWGALLAWTILAEPAAWSQAASGALMLAALCLMHGQRHAHEHAHAAVTHVHRHRHDDGHHDHLHPGLPAWIWHTHEHTHASMTHAHPHRPDLHHRHGH